MAKRRTRKQKEKTKSRNTALATGTLSWNPSSNTDISEADVNRQLQDDQKLHKSAGEKVKSAVSSVKLQDDGAIRRNIRKSLILTSLILALEVVIYFAIEIRR